MAETQLMKRKKRELPGSPAVRIPCFHYKGLGFNSWLKNLRSHMWGSRAAHPRPPSLAKKTKKKEKRTKMNLLDHLTSSSEMDLVLGSIKTLWIALSLFLFSFSFHFSSISPSIYTGLIFFYSNWISFFGEVEKEVWSEAVSSWYYPLSHSE